MIREFINTAAIILSAIDFCNFACVGTTKLESDSEANRRPSLLANVMGCFGGSGSKNDAEEDKRRREANKRIEKQIQKDKQIYRATHRLLLLGQFIYIHVESIIFQLIIFHVFSPFDRRRWVWQKYNCQTNENITC